MLTILILVKVHESRNLTTNLRLPFKTQVTGLKLDENRPKSWYLKKVKEFKIEQGSEFKGIMHYVTNKTGDNIHDKGAVEITSYSICNHPKYM